MSVVRSKSQSRCIEARCDTPGDRRSIYARDHFGQSRAGVVKQGELEEARDLYQQAHDIEVELQDNHGIAFALNGLGLVAEEMGNLGEARSCFEQAISLRRGEDTGSLAASLVNLANVLHKQGDLNAALAAYQEGLQLRFDRGEKPGLVEALRGIASLAAATGQVAVATQIKCAVHHARVQLGIRPTETAKGDGETTALEQRDCGPEPVSLQDAVALAQALSVAGTQHGGDEHHQRSSVSLTEREREILSLVVEGKSDLEIAEVLFIARATVSRHLANVFEKLNVTTRTAAAAWATRKQVK